MRILSEEKKSKTGASIREGIYIPCGNSEMEKTSTYKSDTLPVS